MEKGVRSLWKLRLLKSFSKEPGRRKTGKRKKTPGEGGPMGDGFGGRSK